MINQKEFLNKIVSEIKTVRDENKALEDRVLKLELTLAWYASFENWRAMRVHSDKGSKAREVLNHGKPIFKLHKIKPMRLTNLDKPT